MSTNISLNMSIIHTLKGEIKVIYPKSTNILLPKDVDISDLDLSCDFYFIYLRLKISTRVFSQKFFVKRSHTSDPDAVQDQLSHRRMQS